MMNTQYQQQSLQSSRSPLRRAVYIHISDLTSAYNIDHKKLETEISRVKNDEGKTSQTTETQRLSINEEREAFIPHKRLQTPRTGFNLCVLVGEVKIVVDRLRVDRSRVRLAEVQVGDETGTVSLRARDDQIDLLNEVSKRSGAVVLRNCTLELFQGRHIRLTVTKWGKLNVFPDGVPSTPPPPSKLNCDKNFSLIDLSLVASEMIKNQPHERLSNKGEAQNERNKPSNINRQSSQSSQNMHQRRSSRGNHRAKANRNSAGSKPQAVNFPGILKSDQVGYPPMHAYGYHSAYSDVYSNIYNDAYSDPWSDIMKIQQYYDINLPIPQHHRSNQERLSSAHQLLLNQRSYEMQQQQLQHMHVMHEQHQHQNEQQESMMRSIQTNLDVVPSVITSPTFDTADFPSLPSIEGSHGGKAPSNLKGTSTSHRGHDVGPWRGKLSNISNKDAIVGTAGAMDPQATNFATSYIDPRIGQSIHPPVYQGYNLYEQHWPAFNQQQQHHSMPSQNIVYAPVPGHPTVLAEHSQLQAIDLNHQKVEENNKS